MQSHLLKEENQMKNIIASVPFKLLGIFPLRSLQMHIISPLWVPSFMLRLQYGK